MTRGRTKIISGICLVSTFLASEGVEGHLQLDVVDL